MTEDEEFSDIQISDIRKKTAKISDLRQNKQIKEVLRMMCDFLGRLEALAEIEAQDVAENLEVLLKEHRHQPDGTVVQPM